MVENHRCIRTWQVGWIRQFLSFTISGNIETHKARTNIENKQLSIIST